MAVLDIQALVLALINIPAIFKIPKEGIHHSKSQKVTTVCLCFCMQICKCVVTAFRGNFVMSPGSGT